MKRDYNRVEAAIIYGPNWYVLVNCDYNFINYVVEDRYNDYCRYDEYGRVVYHTNNSGFENWINYVDDTKHIQSYVAKFPNGEIECSVVRNGKHEIVPNHNVILKYDEQTMMYTFKEK